MRLLIDMDGVCADLVSHWVTLLNRYHGETLQKEDVTDWHIHKITEQTTRKEVEAFLADPGFFLHLEPIPGAIETLRRLIRDGHDLVFVTHCKEGHGDKRKWLERHLPGFPMRSVIFAERKELVSGDVLLDDGVHNLRDWQKHNPSGIAVCFDAPYNQHWQGERVTNWEAFYELITLWRQLNDQTNATD